MQLCQSNQTQSISTSPKHNPLLNPYSHTSANWFTIPVQMQKKNEMGNAIFDYKGQMLCNMASFKQHCAFGFWKASLMKDAQLLENAKSESAMGHLGKITSMKDMPSDKNNWLDKRSDEIK